MDFIYSIFFQAQQEQELPGVDQRGGPLPCDRHGARRRHEGNIRTLLRRTQPGTAGNQTFCGLTL